MINLIDVSALIYAGHSVTTNRIPNNIRDELNGLPVGGLRHALDRILTLVAREEQVYCFFDSPTDKDKLYPEYKSNRKFDYNVWIQKEMCYDFLKIIGVPCIRIDGYEADDLIFAASRQLCVSPVSYNCNRIHCDDADMLQCILNETFARYPIVLSRGVVNWDNFSTVSILGSFVDRNAMGAYLMFKGKKSNNVPSMKNGTELYKQYMEWAKENIKFEGHYGLKENVSKFILGKYKENPDEWKLVATEYLKRMPVVFPKEYTEKFDFATKGKFALKEKDKPMFSRLVCRLQLQTLCSSFGVERDNDLKDVYPFTKWIKMYTTGAKQVDNDITVDTSFFAEDSKIGLDEVGGF